MQSKFNLNISPFIDVYWSNW